MIQWFVSVLFFRIRTRNADHASHLDELEETEQSEIKICPSDHDQPGFPSDEHARDAEEHRENRSRETTEYDDDAGPKGAVHQRRERVQEPRETERGW